MDRRRLHTLIGIAALVASSLAAPQAMAAEPSPAEIARARVLFGEGESAARAQRWSEAVDRFERVRAIKETPGVLFHLGAAHEGAGKPSRALELFERALALAKADGVDDVVALSEARVAALADRIARLSVRVVAPAVIADVKLDGAPLAPAQWGEPIRVDPGAHRVEATVRGVPFLREVSLDEGASLTIVVGEGESAPATAAASPSPGPIAERDRDEHPSSEQGDAQRRLPLGPMALGAGGLLLCAGGIASFAVASSESAAAADACSGGGGAECDPAARDTVRTLDHLALGMWIGAAAAVGGAVVWWALDDSGDGGATSAGIGPSGAMLRGRF